MKRENLLKRDLTTSAFILIGVFLFTCGEYIISSLLFAGAAVLSMTSKRKADCTTGCSC